MIKAENIKVGKKKCKSVKQKPITIKDLEKIKQQYIENPIKFQQAIASLIRAGKYSYEMLIAVQQQILCLEAKLKILEAKIKPEVCQLYGNVDYLPCAHFKRSGNLRSPASKKITLRQINSQVDKTAKRLGVEFPK
jgi:hypothetical protein